MSRVSAASFVIEPGNLWQRRISRRFLEQAPRIVTLRAQPTFAVPLGNIAVPVRSVGWHADEIAALTDPWARAEALEAAGIEAEIIYPTFAWSLFAIEDEAFRLSCLRCYNDWLIDLCAASPWRFGFAALIAGGEAGEAELERCAARNARAAIIAADTEDVARPALKAAALLDIPVALLRSHGPLPTHDLQSFARESEVLAEQYAGQGNRFVVLGGVARAGSEMLHIREREVADGGAWGLLGQSAIATGDARFQRDAAAEFHGLKVRA